MVKKYVVHTLSWGREQTSAVSSGLAMINSNQLVVVSGPYERQLMRSALLHLASGDSVSRERHARLGDLRTLPSQRLSAHADQRLRLILLLGAFSGTW